VPVRVRCLSLLLALLAWIVAPAGLRTAGAAATVATAAIAATPTPGAIERGTAESDLRVRPDDLDDGVPPTRSIVRLAASALAVERPLPDAPFVAPPRRSAQPRGPPITVVQ